MNKKGFTLIEVLATVIVLSLISIIAYPNIINTVKKNKDTQLKSFKENAELAADTYIRLYQDEVLGVENGNGRTSGAAYIIKTQKEKYEKVYVNELVKEGLLDKPNFNYKNYIYDEILCRGDKCEYQEADEKYIKGKEYNIDGDDYYVLNTSYKNDSFVTLIKKNSLTKEEITSLGFSVSDINYNIYDKNDNIIETRTAPTVKYCQSTQPCSYDESNIKNIIDAWAQKFSNSLVEVDIGDSDNKYSARLAKSRELKVEKNNIFLNDLYRTKEYFVDPKYNTDYNYWLMDGVNDNIKWNIRRYSKYENDESKLYNIILYGLINEETTSGVRPVINYKKELLNNH